MIAFYIVRHGETLLNSLGRGIIFHAAYASDTFRAGQTAELILLISENRKGCFLYGDNRDKGGATGMEKYKAVIFDLFETLVTEWGP